MAMPYQHSINNSNDKITHNLRTGYDSALSAWCKQLEQQDPHMLRVGHGGSAWWKRLKRRDYALPESGTWWLCQHIVSSLKDKVTHSLRGDTALVLSAWCKQLDSSITHQLRTGHGGFVNIVQAAQRDHSLPESGTWQ